MDLTGRMHVVEESGRGVDEVITERLDQVMDELMTLQADAGIDLELSSREVTFDVLVSAANPLSAVAQASSLLRTAVHAAGGGTPDWPGPDEEAWTITLVSVCSKPVPELMPQPEGPLVGAPA